MTKPIPDYIYASIPLTEQAMRIFFLKVERHKTWGEVFPGLPSPVPIGLTTMPELSGETSFRNPVFDDAIPILDYKKQILNIVEKVSSTEEAAAWSLLTMMFNRERCPFHRVYPKGTTESDIRQATYVGPKHYEFSPAIKGFRFTIHMAPMLKLENEIAFSIEDECELIEKIRAAKENPNWRPSTHYNDRFSVSSELTLRKMEHGCG